jgi:F-type H+-transporting ATPase subunit gamma
MSSGKQIRQQISSIRSTKKITSAMQLVAASKMRKTQAQMQRSRPYADKIRQVIAHLAASHSEYRHPYLVPKEQVNNIGLIVVSTDRGLCGGLNINMFRQVLQHMRQWDRDGKKISLCLVGKKAQSFFSRVGGEVLATAQDLGNKPSMSDVIGVVKTMLDAYDEQKLDQLFIVHNEFVSTMTQKPKLLPLLPLEVSADEDLKHHWDYLYEPEAESLLDVLLKRYIETQVYQSVVENVACEQAARMLAMRNATDNASQLVDELQLKYNKARQAAITQEISEIISGAEAV